MSKKLMFTIIVTTALCCLSANPAEAASYGIKKVKNGVYAVTNLETKKTAFVRDPKAYIKHQNGGRTRGFGKSINQKTFAKGDKSNVVKDAAQATANTAAYAAGAAYNVVNQVPSWRKVTRPVGAVLSGNSKKKK